jgi:hypothetical protein
MNAWNGDAPGELPGIREVIRDRWSGGRTGAQEEGMEWIDPHVHILPPRRMAGLVRWVRKFTPGFPVSEGITPEEIVSP